MKGHPKQDLVHDIVETNELWHRRLAHDHYRALTLASTNTCKGPAKERIQRRHFQVARARQKESWKSSTPMSSSSLSGYVYYVSFIDDFSRNTWIYFLKNKDDVFNKFKEFKALIENHTEKKIKTFRSDNDGEFTSNEFKELCIDSGIKREFTTPYNPQQNVVAERKNRTIMEVARERFMIKIFPCIYGQKLPEQQCMYRTRHLST